MTSGNFDNRKYITRPNLTKKWLLVCILSSLSLGQAYATQAVGQIQPNQAQATNSSTAPKTLGGLLTNKSASKFLPVNQAFGVGASQDGTTISVRFAITPEHYIYKDKLQLRLPKGVSAGDWRFSSSPTTVDDPEFGKVAVFEQDVIATATLSFDQTAQDGEAVVVWQGCAKAGLCYPPERTKLALIAQDSAVSTKAGKADKTNLQDNKADNTTKTDNGKTDNKADNGKIDGKASKTDGKPTADQSQPKQSNFNDKPNDTTPKDDNLATNLNQDDKTSTSNLQDISNVSAQNPNATTPNSYTLSHTRQINEGFGLQNNPVLAVVLLFLAGLTLAFSACVYPMIPIVANIVARSHSPSAMRGLALTGAYGVGVATSYGVLGAMIAWAGRSLGIIGWLQNPWVLMGVAGLFVLLALMMMDVIRLRLPSTIRNKLNQTSQVADHYLGHVGGSFVVGALSALVVSPCVSAPLAGALVAVSLSGNVLLGFVALFALGLGLSLPLMVMGVAQGKLMPKTGAWMEQIKFFGGLMLLAVALMLVNRVFLSPVMLLCWAVWFSLMAMFLWRLGRLICQALGLLSAFWALCLMAGVAMGSQEVWQPLGKLGTQVADTKPSLTPHLAPNDTKPLTDIRITSLNELDQILADTPKVIVDVTADWCIECRIMERTLFTHRPAQMSDWQLVRLDITETTDDSQAILERYRLFGPPALLYYKQGELIDVQLGEVTRADFEQALLN